MFNVLANEVLNLAIRRIFTASRLLDCTFAPLACNGARDFDFKCVTRITKVGHHMAHSASLQYSAGLCSFDLPKLGLNRTQQSH